MISNEMFGSDIIRVKINGYLKNNTENELITFNEKGIKNKEKISFVFDGVKYSIKINDNDILLVRDGNDFINSFSFRNMVKVTIILKNMVILLIWILI